MIGSFVFLNKHFQCGIGKGEVGNNMGKIDKFEGFRIQYFNFLKQVYDEFCNNNNNNNNKQMIVPNEEMASNKRTAFCLDESSLLHLLIEKNQINIF